MGRRSISRARVPRTAKKRIAASADRDRAIVRAALQEFTQQGFAAARMDDIARRAGVAKGTIYLRFKNKEALFEAIIHQEISPLVNAAATAIEPGESIRAFLERTMMPLVSGSGRFRRTAVLRLLISEAARFPKLAELYFHTIVEPGLEIFSRLVRKAFEKRELSSPALVRFPQLLLAPAIMGLLWSVLFDRFHPLDMEAMLRAHFDQLFPSKTR